MSDVANSRARHARTWVALADLIDRQLSPLGLAAIEALNPRSGETILDIGCGNGQTVLQLAAHVGPHGRVIGVDIAPALLEVAKARATDLPQATFIEGDATHLDMPAGSIDGLYSRFGVMAFADPLAAFANFRRMLKADGSFAFVCWRSLTENELDDLPLQATGLKHLVDQTPFSFEDPTHVTHLLTRAGFREVVIRPLDQPVSVGGMDATLAVLTGVGALGRILRENPDLRADAEPNVRTALEGRQCDGEVWLNAACWLVTVRA